jgi:hypothetical protein
MTTFRNPCPDQVPICSTAENKPPLALPLVSDSLEQRRPNKRVATWRRVELSLVQDRNITFP